MQFPNGPKLRQEICRAGLSEAKVAARLKVAKSTLSRWLTGDVEPSDVAQKSIEKLFPDVKRPWRREQQQDASPRRVTTASGAEQGGSSMPENPYTVSPLTVEAVTLGLLKPSEQFKRDLQSAVGIPVASWSTAPEGEEAYAATGETFELFAKLIQESRRFSTGLMKVLPRTVAALETDSVVDALRDIVAEFAALTRGICCGKRYPDDPTELARFITAQLDRLGCYILSSFLFNVATGYAVATEAAA